MTNAEQPVTAAGRMLLDALHYKGIVVLDDGYFEDKDASEAIRAIEREAAAAAVSVERLETALHQAARHFGSLDGQAAYDVADYILARLATPSPEDDKEEE